MSIGALLLQPRKVDPQLGWDSALLDDVLALAARLGWDQAHGGHAIALILRAAEKVLGGMVAHTDAGRAAAFAKFQALLQPLVDRLSSVADSLPKEADAHEVFAGAEQLAQLLVDLASALTVEQFHAKLDEVLRIVSEDLGLTNDYVQAQVAALFEEAIRRLRTMPIDANPQVRDNRREIAALLRRIERALRGLFVMPPLNADLLAGPVFDALRKLDFDGVTRRATAAVTAAKDGLTAATALSDLVPFSMGFGAQGPGAAETGSATKTKKLWYASWLTSDDIRGTDIAKDPSLSKYTFKTWKPERMEQMSFFSNIIATLLKTGFTFGMGLHKGSFTNTFLQTATGLLAVALMIWADYDLNDLPWYATLGIVLGTAILANFEGRSFDDGDAWLYFFRLFYNVLAILGGLPFDKVRDGMLQLMTHVNYEGSTDEPLPGDVDQRPENRNKIDGMTLLHMQIVGGLIHFALMPRNFFSVGFFEKNSRGDSHHPLGTFFAAVVLGGLGLSIVTFFTFGTITACIPPLWPDGKVAALVWLKGYLASLSSFLGFFYLFNDGKTDDGIRGYLPDDSRGTEAVFPGYPKPGVSPYLLPFAGDDEQCIQGNHGIWSHNSTRDVPLDFAYDFSMHRGAEVLCMRAGTVFSAQDDDAGGDPHSGNNIVIKHSSIVDGVDIDQGGAKVATYATYMHAQAGSIKAAFGGSVPAPGTAVPQGKVIMKCNSSGDSWFNLLHVDVRPDGAGTPKGYTIPFVFHDADVQGDDGQPQSQSYYASDNQRV